WSTFARATGTPQQGTLARKALDRLENELIPQFMAAQRWYAGKDATNPDRTTSAAEAASAGEGKAGARAQLLGQAEWTIAPGNSALLALFEVDDSRYFVPLSLIWEDSGRDSSRMPG